MNGQKKVAVIAGTPVDTQMGADFLAAKNSELDIICCPVSANPQEQTLFQFSSQAEKEKTMQAIFDKLEAQGVKDYFIYCNSLSGAVDFDTIAAQRGLHIHTPLQVYTDVAKQYSRIGAMAANNQSAYGIERTALAANPNVRVAGAGLLELVCDVEKQRDPYEMMSTRGIKELLAFFKAYGVECLILGCTHFPYFREALNELTSLPVIDPAEVMYQRLIDGMNRA